MVIGTRQRIGDSASKESLGITINGIQLKNCLEYTYLGLTIDSHLSWNAQVEMVCKKLGSRVAMLQRMRGTFSCAQLNTLYFSFVQPHVDYALSVWGNTTQQNLQRVQRHLNRSARIVSNNFDFDVPSLSIIEGLKWQTISERRDFLKCTLVYKCLNALAPTYLSDMFTYTADAHSRLTRQVTTNCLYVPAANTQHFQNSLIVSGARLWNNMPSTLREANTLSSFKYLYKHRNVS